MQKKNVLSDPFKLPAHWLLKGTQSAYGAALTWTLLLPFRYMYLKNRWKGLHTFEKIKLSPS